jgi:hypothetical protein
MTINAGEVTVEPVSTAQLVTKEVIVPGNLVSAPKTDEAPKDPEQAAPVVEEPKKEEPKGDDKYGAKLSKLKERERLVESRESEAAEKLAKADEVLAKESEIKTLIKKSPLKALEQLGVTFEDITKAILNEEDPDPKYDALKAKIDELEGKLTAEEVAEKEAKEAAEQARLDKAIDFHKTRIKEEVDANEDKYELVKLNDAYDLVFDVTEQYFEQHGVLLSADKAAEHVEKWLEERAETIVKSKKVQAKLPKSESPKDKPRTVTLTNQASNFAAPILPPGEKLSKEERLKRSASMIRFT